MIELPYSEKTMTICYAIFIWYRNVTAGPMAWNALPDDLRDTSLSADNLEKTLKTHLFRNALGHLAHWRRCVMRYINLRLTYLLTYLLTDRQTDGRTDRYTDRFAISISRISMLTRDKNAQFFETWCNYIRTYILYQLMKTWLSCSLIITAFSSTSSVIPSFTSRAYRRTSRDFVNPISARPFGAASRAVLWLATSPYWRTGAPTPQLASEHCGNGRMSAAAASQIILYSQAALNTFSTLILSYTCQQNSIALIAYF